MLERNYSTDSHDYEWDSFSIESIELSVDFIHHYSNKSEVVDEILVALDESKPYIMLIDHIDHERGLVDLGVFEGNLIDL